MSLYQLDRSRGGLRRDIPHLFQTSSQLVATRFELSELTSRTVLLTFECEYSLQHIHQQNYS